MKKIYLMLLFSLAGCSFMPWSTLKPGEYKDKGRRFSSNVPDEWMRFNHERYFLMSRDGVALEFIEVQRFRYKDELEKTKKRYSEDMSADELAEVEIDNYKSDESIRNFQVSKNQPATVDGKQGYVLEFTYETAKGLPVRGIQFGFHNASIEYGNRVYRLRYIAPVQYYFEHYRAVFEEFVKNFKVLA